MPLQNFNTNKVLVDADIPASLARDTETTAAIAAHNNEVWPHAEWWKYLFPYLWNIFLPRDRTGQNPTYTTEAEVTTAIASHTAAVDPHPVYLTQTEGDERYLQPTKQAVFQAFLGGVLSPGAYASSTIGSTRPVASIVDITGRIIIGGKIVPPGGLANGQYNYNFAISMSTGWIEIHIKSSDFSSSSLPVMILVRYLN